MRGRCLGIRHLRECEKSAENVLGHFLATLGVQSRTSSRCTAASRVSGHLLSVISRSSVRIRLSALILTLWCQVLPHAVYSRGSLKRYLTKPFPKLRHRSRVNLAVIVFRSAPHRMLTSSPAFRALKP